MYRICYAALAITCAVTGCAGSDEDETTTTEAAVWTPQYVGARCLNPEPVHTPPKGGACQVEIRLKSLAFTNGQGVTEGRGEIRGIFEAQLIGAPAGTGYKQAVAETRSYSPGQRSGFNESLGSYRVPVGQTRDVSVCASIVESDNDGFNGGDDWARPCTVVTLRCDATVGQPTRTVPMSAPLCEAPGDCNGSVRATLEVITEDADGDTIPNADDFTPERCDEERKGTAGTALILYFHYDDSGLTTLAQSMWTNLVQAYAAYDYVVLVADSETSNPLGTSDAAWAQADLVLPPTRAGLIEAMRHVTARGLRMDIDIHAHGYKFGTTDSEFETLDKSWDPVKNVEEPDHLTGKELEDATDPDLIGTARGGIPIVAWWSTTCISQRSIDSWQRLGAKVASGAVDIQFYPNAWGNYIDNWTSGDTYRTAVDTSLTNAVRNQARTLVYTQGAAPPWNCGNLSSVLLQTACAADFFVDTDGDGSDKAAYKVNGFYDPAETGAKNMEDASFRTFIGDTTIRFGGVGLTWP